MKKIVKFMMIMMIAGEFIKVQQMRTVMSAVLYTYQNDF